MNLQQHILVIGALTVFYIWISWDFIRLKKKRFSSRHFEGEKISLGFSRLAKGDVISARPGPNSLINLLAMSNEPFNLQVNGKGSRSVPVSCRRHYKVEINFLPETTIEAIEGVEIELTATPKGGNIVAEIAASKTPWQIMKNDIVGWIVWGAVYILIGSIF